MAGRADGAKELTEEGMSPLAEHCPKRNCSSLFFKPDLLQVFQVAVKGGPPPVAQARSLQVPKPFPPPQPTHPPRSWCLLPAINDTGYLIFMIINDI